MRLTLALAPWWQLRGRLSAQAQLLAAAAEYAEPGSDEWCAARLFLGQVTGEAEDPPAMLEHFTAVRDALEDPRRPAGPAGPVLLPMCLGARAAALLRMGRVAEAVEDGRRALDLARQTGFGGLEAMALAFLSLATWYQGDRDGALQLARQAQQIADDYSGSLQRGLGQIVAGVLTETGDLAAAEQACTATLASCRDAGDQANLCGVLWHLMIVDLRTGRTGEAAAHLRELLQIATQTGVRPLIHAGLDCCGHLCAATGRPAEAVTAWAAMSALAGPWPVLRGGLNPARRDALRQQAQALLGPAGARAAEERGAAMSLATATEYALLLAAEPQPPAVEYRGGARVGGRWGGRPGPGSAPGSANWSPWSRGAVPTRRSRRSCTSPCARSARTWTGSGTRRAAAAAPISPGWPSAPAWSSRTANSSSRTLPCPGSLTAMAPTVNHHGYGLVHGEARGGDRRRLGHGPRAYPPAGGAGLLGGGLRP